MPEVAPALDLRTGPQRTFLHLLLSTLVVSVINFTVWFAVTFWVYLETKSVFATGDRRDLPGVHRGTAVVVSGASSGRWSTATRSGS